MRFESLSITNLRCLTQLEFSPGAETSLIWGANGSGKTSVLEAFALASWGKSFLSNRALDIVRSGSEGLSVRAVLNGEAGGRFAVAVRKQAGETAISVDGQAIQAASVLAQRVPMLVINSKAADILTENPSNRRALIDRTMFHVEPGYVSAWKSYRTALRQRNELLRRQAPVREAGFWNQQLVSLAEQIDLRRQQVVACVNQALADNPLQERLGPLKLHYAPGWNRTQGLLQELEQSWTRDLRSGYTASGMHRADVALRGDGKTVARRISRGQGKFIVCSILMALAGFIHREVGIRPVILVDDLAAELDDKMRSGVVDMINRSGGQRVFTAIKIAELPEVAESTQSMFHVEQAYPAAIA